MMKMMKAALLAAALLLCTTRTIHGFETVDLTGRLAGATLQYQINEGDPNADGEDTMTVILEVPVVAWVGFAFNTGNGEMVGSEAVIGMPSDGSVMKYGPIDRRAIGGIVPMPEEQQTLIDTSVTQTDTTTTLQFTKILLEPNEIPILKDADNVFLSAWGSSNTFGYHAQREDYTTFLQVDDVPTPVPETLTPVPAEAAINGTMTPVPEESMEPTGTDTPVPAEESSAPSGTPIPATPVPTPVPTYDCEAECATALLEDEGECNLSYLHVCAEDDGRTLCTESNNATEPCRGGNNRPIADCVCVNPPPNCTETCPVALADEECQRDYLHTCGATPDVPVCTNNETSPFECSWGPCTCENPPPACAPCEEVIAETECFLDYIHTCESTENLDFLCSTSEVPEFECEWGSCTCENIPPNCTDVCSTLADDCTEGYVHTCASNPEFGEICSQSEMLPFNCTWGACTCVNPEPNCTETCAELLEEDYDYETDCFSDYIHTCGALPEIDPICSPSGMLPFNCSWGACTCENPTPPCASCDDVIAENECFEDYIHTCAAFPNLGPICTSNATVECPWGGCTCENPIPQCPNCTDVLEVANCGGQTTHAHWCAALEEPLCTNSNSTPPDVICEWGDWCNACGLDGSTFAPTMAPPTTPAPVVTPAPVTPAPVTPAPVTPAPVTPAPADMTTDPPVEEPTSTTDPPSNATDAPTDAGATDPPGDSGSSSLFLTRAISLFGIVVSMMIVA